MVFAYLQGLVNVQYASSDESDGNESDFERECESEVDFSIAESYSEPPSVEDSDRPGHSKGGQTVTEIDLDLESFWSDFTGQPGPRHSLSHDDRPIYYYSLFVDEEFPTTACLSRPAPADHQITRLCGRKRQCFQCRTFGSHADSKLIPKAVYDFSICSVHLCQGRCFALFHTNLN